MTCLQSQECVPPQTSETQAQPPPGCLYLQQLPTTSSPKVHQEDTGVLFTFVSLLRCVLWDLKTPPLHPSRQCFDYAFSKTTNIEEAEDLEFAFSGSGVTVAAGDIFYFTASLEAHICSRDQQNPPSENKREQCGEWIMQTMAWLFTTTAPSTISCGTVQSVKTDIKLHSTKTFYKQTPDSLATATNVVMNLYLIVEC